VIFSQKTSKISEFYTREESKKKNPNVFVQKACMRRKKKHYMGNWEW
jgi:hypothetical protein